MKPAHIPGSSEPYSVDVDVATLSQSSPFDDREHDLNTIPQHPHIKTKAEATSSGAQSKPQLSSMMHPIIVSSSNRHESQIDAASDSPQKRKSIGSKLLSKFKQTPSDEKGDPHSSSHSQAPSGSHTPARPAIGSDDVAEVEANQLRKALAQEQRKRAKAKRTSFGSIDGLRSIRRFGGKPKKVQQDPDVDEHDYQRVSEETARYVSEQPSNLDRFRSGSTRHLPGGLYEAEETELEARFMRDREASAHLSGEQARRTVTPLDQPKDLFAPLGDKLDDLFDDAGPHDYESDASDDTIAHLICEANGYDSLRYNANGDMSAGIDFDTLQAVREKEHSLSDNKDVHSGHSAYSGGAAKALSQPLLELEDIELETFLQNFARHTREVTVTRASGMQKYRMPKWSDFRVLPDDSVATSPNNKLPSMLSRVDRGLHHLSDDPLKPGTVPDQSQTDLAPLCRSKHADDGLEPDCTSDDVDHDVKKSTLSRMKSQGKTSKRNASDNSKWSLDQNDANNEDWDLIVPSSGDATRLEADSELGELRVNAEDEGVDGVAFCIAYILALVERLAPEEIDHHPDRGYREGLIRSHLERLYTIAPFWEQLAFRIRRLYRWEDPKTTAAAAMIYFVLWYTNMIPTAFILMIMFYIMRFKYFPPSESYLHEKVKMRMARGKAANTLSEKLRRRSRLDILNIYRRWVVTFGAPTQEAMGLVADFHEKVKNLILWRNPGASRRTLMLFGVLNLFVTFAPAQYVSKAIFFFLGITFFCLLPLQSYFPSHRKALSPLWWATFGAPTDAQFAVQLLRKRHLDVDRFAGRMTSAADVRRAVQSRASRYKLKPRPDRREEGIAYDQIEDPSRASTDYVETTNDATLKPRKLGSFFCQYKGLPGRLHVNTKYLYFTPLHSPSQKRGRTPIDAIESIVKTKSIRLMVWSSLGLKIVRNNGQAPLLLANLPNRDEAFNLILAVSANGK